MRMLSWEYSLLSSPERRYGWFRRRGRVRLVVEKPNQAICAIVGALRFGHPCLQSLHQYLAAISYGKPLLAVETDRLRSDASKNLVQQRELPIGDVIQAAIDNGLRVEAGFDGTF